jgi:hypothetical protein
VNSNSPPVLIWPESNFTEAFGSAVAVWGSAPTVVHVTVVPTVIVQSSGTNFREAFISTVPSQVSPAGGEVGPAGRPVALSLAQAVVRRASAATTATP